ncbi:MAG: flagellar hook basal-body protein [Lentisphaeraceae bacterium]|nr:flagellar hook basal-body protein [Lentisphaeraceae bacterium]
MSVIYKVLSSMDLEMKRQESISRNLAGSQIPGFKGETVISTDFDGYVDSYNKSGQGTLDGGNVVSFSEGSLKHTGRPLDFAISGDGFFEVTTPEGNTFYTRNGRFVLSPSGEVQTVDGFKLEAKVGDFQLNERDSLNSLTVRDDGYLTIGTGDDQKELGQIKIVKIENLEQLTRLSSSYFQLQPNLQNLASEAERGEYSISGKTIEGANVSPVKEMITMIDSMRKYELSQRLMKMREGIRNKEYQTFGS